MDVLTKKLYQDVNYISRYSTVPYYYHTVDQKWIFGIGSNLYKSSSYVDVKIGESDTLEKLALTYYNNPTLYWVIALFNDIDDTFDTLSDYYSTLKVPSISEIKFGDER